MKNIKALVMGLAMVGLMSATTSQAVIYTDGNPGDWTDDGTGNSVPVTAIPSGGPSGGAYTEINNVPDEYSVDYGTPSGYGAGPYSQFGPGITTSGNFYQSVAVYINANWAPAALPEPSFWIDETPNSTDSGNYWGAEHNFQVTANGSSVSVSPDAQSPMATITSSGWYTFQMLYEHAVNPTDPVITVMNIYNDADNSLVGSATVLGTSSGELTQSQNLTGSGYVWFTVWQNGFAGDTLDVADVAAVAVPEPTTVTMTGGALLLLFSLRTLRKARSV